MRDAITSLTLALCCALLSAAAGASAGNSRAASQDIARAESLLQAANVPCAVTAALKLSAAAVTEGRRGKSRPAAQSDRYEVSCREGLGYIVSAASGRDSRPTAALCLESDGQDQADTCSLPGNHSELQRTAVAKLLASAGAGSCTMDRYRFAGRSVVKTFIEVSCRGADGYLLAASNPVDPDKPVAAVLCMAIADTAPLGCRLSSRNATVAALTVAAESQFMHESGRVQCKVRERRYIMTDAGGNSYFEFMCQDGANYIMARLAGGRFGGSDECTAAIVTDLGGCKLPKPAN